MQLYEAGLNDRQIAEKLRVSHHHVVNHRREQNLPPKQKQHPWNAEVFMELYVAGYSDVMIAREMKITTGNVSERRRALWLKANPKYYRVGNMLRVVGEEKDQPLRGHESLFCDTAFLENLIGRKLESEACP
jgi:hypothetical protein